MTISRVHRTAFYLLLPVIIGGLFFFLTQSARCQSSSRSKDAETRVRPRLTKELKQAGLEWGSPVFLRAFKEERILELWIQESGKNTFKLFRTYPIAAASGKLGPKQREGDHQVPEGFYTVPPKMMNPKSRFHLAFNIGYPNAYDRKLGRTGSFIMVHGSNVSVGCLAMTDSKIEEIFSLCAAAHRKNQKKFQIHIFPFRMTPARLARERNNPWYEFWENLQTGYSIFETQKSPPSVSLAGRKYDFSIKK